VTAFSQESRPDNTELATVFKRNRTADCVHLLTTDYGSGLNGFLTTDYGNGLNGLLTTDYGSGLNGLSERIERIEWIMARSVPLRLRP
jgi:hypothetical protein